MREEATLKKGKKEKKEKVGPTAYGTVVSSFSAVEIIIPKKYY